MNHRLLTLHKKTSAVADEDLPFTPRNVLLQKEDVCRLFDAHGMAGLAPRNINLYRTAFVHKSYCTPKNSTYEEANARCPQGCLPLQDVSYERLEHMGDSLLGFVVARYLYERFPDQNEGFLSRLKTLIVNGKRLADLSSKIGFPRFAIMSKQVEEGGGRKNQAIMEDIFEAFVAAVYLDFQTDADGVALPADLARVFPGGPMSGAGFFVAEAWIVGILEKYLDFAELVRGRVNYKETLTRYMGSTLQDTPRFFEVSVRARGAGKEYTCTVKDKAGAVLGTGTGESRKDAENEAARAALVFYGQL